MTGRVEMDGVGIGVGVEAILASEVNAPQPGTT